MKRCFLHLCLSYCKTMKHIFQYILFVFFVYFVFKSEAQVHFSNLTIKDGLSQSTVKCLFQDSRGFIWAGTADGLNKFNGYEFVNYRKSPNTRNSISGNDISCIYENRFDSTLWIGTQDGGLNMYNRDFNNFIRFRFNSNVKSSIPSDYITDLLVTEDSTLWIATRTGGLCSFNKSDSTFYRPEFSMQSKFRMINCIAEDSDGDLWIGTNNGLYVWKRENQFKDSEPLRVDIFDSKIEKSITALEFDVKGYLWIGTKNRGLYRYHQVSKDIESFSAFNASNQFKSAVSINTIVETDLNEIWIGTNRGLYKYSFLTNSFVNYKNEKNNPESLSNNNVFSILKDKSGILWVGTFIGGMDKMDRFQYRFPKFSNSFLNSTRSNSVFNLQSIHVDSRNTIWIGTSIGLFETTKGNLNKGVAPVKTYFPNTSVGQVASSEEVVIASTNTGIFQIKNGEVKDLSAIIEKQVGIRVINFSSSITDENNNIWLATAYGILKFTPHDKRFELYNPIGKNNKSKRILTVAVTQDYTGKLWIGTFSGDLYSFDVHSKKFKLVLSNKNANKQLGYNKIFSICENKPHQIWFGTDGGLFHYDADSSKTKRFLDLDGLPNNVVYAVLPDKKGRLWCSTNVGISCFNPVNNTFRNYTYKDGLQSNEFNEGAYFSDKNGTIYLGGINGLNIFDPLKIETNPYSPPVVITNMEIQYKKVTPETHPDIIDKQISETKSLKLSFRQNTFSFEFVALSYSLPERNKYKYALTEIGKPDDWINAGHRRFATFTNVPPGEYVFKVKGSNSDGLWTETPTTLYLSIQPPYWGTWWFRVAFLLLTVGLTFLFIWLRIRGINKQKVILKKLVKEKTEAIQKQTLLIENQNKELKQINKNIRKKNTQLNEQQIHIIKQRDNLLKMAEKVDEVTQSKLRFFISISHELRTPLTLIISPLKRLIENLEKTDTKEIKRKLANVYTNSSKLLLTVNQLLDFRKTETGKMILHVSEIDLITFTQKIAVLFNDLAKQKNIKFSFGSTREKLMVWVDVDKLEKIIYNLLSNAFKFTPESGEVKLEVSFIKKDESSFATLTFRDNGIGIEKSKLPFIFDHFYQLEQPSNVHQVGSGLGLALVEKYVELHKGAIVVNSAEGEGTEFIVNIPVGRNHFDEQTTFVNEQAENLELLQASIGDYIPILSKRFESTPKNHLPSLLIIEDDENLRSYLKEMLADEYNIEEASRAVKGLQIADAKHPDLIICDVMLPNVNGFEVCKKIKSDFKLNHIPVVLLTSLADEESRLSGIKAGADAFLTKPFDLQHLVLLINNLLENRKKLQQKYSLYGTEDFNGAVANTKDEEFIKKAIQLIEDNIVNTSFNVELFCEKMQISQPQCYRKIKAISGNNISEFIRNIRLKKAAQLLKTGKYKINEVAYETGFNDPNYFTKSFTKLYGITPRDFIS